MKTKEFYFFLIVVLMSLTAIETEAQVNKQDSLILVKLYHATGGPNWKFQFGQSDWLVGRVGSWTGVSV